jgi:pimeloyl-ACP methyl ester carboxylesterase
MELVTVTTSDYVRLHGVYSASSATTRTSVFKGSVDAAVIVHGIGGNFYSSRILNHVAETLKLLGISVVSINTRGHDMVNMVSWGGQARTVGSAFENVDDCRWDLLAWHNFLLERGHANIVFVGHSLGAIKALYSAAKEPPPKLRAVIALSPSRLSYRRMLITSSDGLFRDTYQRCELLVESGHGQEPVSVEFPVSAWMTPNCYLDKYGPAERYNWLTFIEQVPVPSLLLFGEKELTSHPAFIGLDREWEPFRAKLNSIEFITVKDADHFYSSKYDEVDDLILRWLQRD